MNISTSQWRALLLRSDLSLTLKGMGCTMAEYADWETGKHARPGLDKLAMLNQVDHSTAKRNLKKLEDLGWIRKTFDGRHGGQNRNWANEYELTIPDLRSEVTHDEKPDHSSEVVLDTDHSSKMTGPKVNSDPPPIHTPKITITSNNYNGERSKMSYGQHDSHLDSEGLGLPQGFLTPETQARGQDNVPPGMVACYMSSAERGRKLRRAGNSHARPGEEFVIVSEEEYDRGYLPANPLAFLDD